MTYDELMHSKVGIYHLKSELSAESRRWKQELYSYPSRELLEITRNPLQHRSLYYALDELADRIASDTPNNSDGFTVDTTHKPDGFTVD